eukprot:8315057-Pyramimonas_sp.AAC.1
MTASPARLPVGSSIPPATASAVPAGSFRARPALALGPGRRHLGAGGTSDAACLLLWPPSRISSGLALAAW